MRVYLSDSSFSLTLQELADIVDGREMAAKMETKMYNGKENPLCVEYNNGVAMMAKYMKDWFLNKLDEEQSKRMW